MVLLWDNVTVIPQESPSLSQTIQTERTTLFFNTYNRGNAGFR